MRRHTINNRCWVRINGFSIAIINEPTYHAPTCALELHLKTLLPFFLILLSGCTTAPRYTYQSQTNTDPVFVFGDRFGGGSVNSPARSFGINTKDAAANRCADFEEVGTTSNHWMHLNSRTKEIKTPAGKAVTIRSNYLYSSGIIIISCVPPPLMFIPNEGAIYSVDIDMIKRTCQLSIVRKSPNGQLEKVEGLTLLPVCKEQ